MTLQLDSTATKLYAAVQAQAGALPAQVEQAIEAKIAAQNNAPLSADQLQQVLLDAMPGQAAQIKQAACNCGHICDGKNGEFVSTVATLLIEKERNEVYNPPPAQPRRPTYRDPLTAEVIIGKDVDFLVIANAGIFDADKKPLAMKVLARENADLSKINEVLNQFHTTWGDKPDIVKVPNDAAYFKLADMEDHEFQFGHGIAAVSFNKAGKEMGRNGKIQPTNKLTTRYFLPKNENGTLVPDLTKPVGAPQLQQGPQLDTTPVTSYQDQIELKLKVADGAPKGAWLDTRLQFVSGSLDVGQGYLLEPGSSGTISFLNSAVQGAVKNDDFSFKGSAAAQSPLNLASYATWTLQQLLNSNLTETTKSVNNSDQRSTNTAAKSFIFRNADQITVAGQKFNPLADVSLTAETMAAAGVKAQLQPLAGDPGKDGFCVSMDIGKGFASGSKGSLEGWTMEVGYWAGSSWVSAGTKGLGSAASDHGCFTLAVDNPTQSIAANHSIEIRLRNQDGVPATRVMVPFKELKWAA